MKFRPVVEAVERQKETADVLNMLSLENQQ
jgi:hypothetical protein